jgi:hypothetical protein
MASGDFTGSGLADLAVGNITAAGNVQPTTILFSGYQTTSTTQTATNGANIGIRSVDAVTSSSNYSSTTSNTLALPGGTLAITTSPANTAAYGVSVTLTAAPPINGGNVPTGSVLFYDGTTLLNTATLSGGVATYATSALAVGVHTISARYTGDSHYSYTTSQPLTSPTLNFRVTGSASTMAVLSGPITSFTSGGNVGVITVAEKDASGNIMTSANQITLTISGGTTAGTFTTGTATGTSVPTPTYVNGVATFDLSTLPLMAVSSTQTYTLTYADSVGGSPSNTSTVTVGVPSALYIVTNFTDPGTSPACTNQNVASPTLDANCTLRLALTDATTSGGTIAFNNSIVGGGWPKTITLASALNTINWTGPLTIAGPGPANLIISGGNSPGTAADFAIFHEGTTNTSLFSLSGMTIENAYGGNNGPALYLYGPTNITNVNFLNNKQSSAASGGAVFVATTSVGALNIQNSTFQGNTDTGGSGGALSDTGTGAVTINNSSFINSTAGPSTGTQGGAVYIAGGSSTTYIPSITITNSLFTGNTCTGSGGAVNITANTAQVNAAVLTFANDTFYNNSCSGTTSSAGAIYLSGPSATHPDTGTLANLTIVGNSLTNAAATQCYGGGISAGTFAVITLANSVVAGNEVACTVSTKDIADGYIVGAGSTSPGTLTGGSGNISTYAYPGLVALGLSDLGSYGGPTQTMVPLPGSVMLKYGSTFTGDTNATDARGYVRPTTGTNTIDIGAVQTNPSLSFTAQPVSTTTGTAFSPAPAVAYLDSGFSLNTTNSQVVPITLTLDPGILSGTTTANLSSGAATFSSVNSSNPEKGAILIASSGSGVGLISAASTTPFNITGSANQLIFSTKPSTPITAGGASASVIVDEADSGGNTIIGSAAAVTLTITATGFTTYTSSPVTPVNGVATFSGLPTLTISGIYTYTVTATGLGSAAATETVNAGATTKLAVTTTAGSPQTPGAAFNVTVTAEDVNSNKTTAYAGTVAITSTDSAAGLPTSSTLTAGVKTFSVTLNTGGSWTVTATDTVSTGITGVSSSITVNTPETIAATSPTVAYTGSSPAGLSTDYTVTPSTGLSFSGGTAPTCTSAAAASASYAPGSYSITCSGAVLSGYAFSYTAGTLTIAEIVTATNQSVTSGGSMPSLTYTINPTLTPTTPPTCSSTANASSTPGVYPGAITCSGAASAGYSFVYVAGQMTVLSGTVASVTVTGYPTTDSNGTASNVTVTMRDSGNNVVTGYAGTVTLTSSDPTMTYSQVSSVNGVVTLSVTMNTAGTQSITATDSVTSLYGSQTGINVGDLIWVVNSNGTLSKLNSAGGGVSSGSGFSGNTPATGIAFDHSGNVWSLSSTSLVEFSNTGTASGPYTGGGINTPAALTVDGNGAVWVVNGNGSVSQFTNSGTAISPSTGYTDSSISSPTGVAIDNAGAIWISNGGNNSITQMLGVAQPVITPLVTAVQSNSIGVKP